MGWSTLAPLNIFNAVKLENLITCVNVVILTVQLNTLIESFANKTTFYGFNQVEIAF